MKLLYVVVAGITMASCAHPLEQVVNQQREARLAASYADKPVHSGAGDGLGAIVSRTDAGYTVEREIAR